MKVLVVLALVNLACAFKLFKNIIVADDNNFEEVIGTRGSYTLVNFYSVTCDHCQKLAPLYEPLATLFKDTNVQIAQVEGRENKRVRNQQQIRGFPTIRLYHFDGTHVASFTGDRTTERLAQFVEDHTGVRAKWPEVKTIQMDNSTGVESIIEENPKGRLMVAFVAPWTHGFTDRLNIYERVASKFPDVQFVSVDVSSEQNSDIVSKYRVDSYPTFLYFDKDDSPTFRYFVDHDTTEDRIAKFLMGQLGEEYDSLETLQDDRSTYLEDKEPSRKYGFNRGFVEEDNGDDDLEDEKWKKLREL